MVSRYSPRFNAAQQTPTPITLDSLSLKFAVCENARVRVVKKETTRTR